MIYSDIDFSLTEHPLTKELIVKKDIAAVKQALKNLLMLNLGEKPFRPDIFGGLTTYLFENPTPELIATLKRNIRNVLTTFEPRATILDINVYSLTDSNALQLEIIFSVINLPTREVLTLNLERVR